VSFKEHCLYCSHTRDDHSLPGRVCAICTRERDGVPYEPGEPRCEGFRGSTMCGICGGRMTWHPDVMQYLHANEADDDDHEAEPRTRRSRRKT